MFNELDYELDNDWLMDRYDDLNGTSEDEVDDWYQENEIEGDDE